MGTVRLGPRVQADLEQLGVGAYAPLDGFLGEADYRSVVARMRLADGRPWALPVVLPATEAEAAALRIGERVRLIDLSGAEVGALDLTERYYVDLDAEVRAVYGTADPAHPGVAARLAEGPIALAGPVTLSAARLHARFAPRAMTPAETRAAFAALGWRTVVGFQTRNPIHRAHEYLLKVALETVDGLLVHPLVGVTKDDDLPAEVRIRCYEVLLATWFPADRVRLALWPAAMRYAGPREAVHHALVRRNYGCTHFIVGRDHAGVGAYYGSYDAHRIFDRFAPGELGITPLFFEHAFFCRSCEGMASSKSCPHPPATRVTLSGTKVRERLTAGLPLPAEFTRPEVAAVLAAHAAGTAARSGPGADAPALPSAPHQPDPAGRETDGHPARSPVKQAGAQAPAGSAAPPVKGVRSGAPGRGPREAELRGVSERRPGLAWPEQQPARSPVKQAGAQAPEEVEQ